MMDILKELMGTLPHMIPFAMSVNGKIKINFARVLEMIIFAVIVLAFLFQGFEELKAEMIDVKEGQEEIQEKQEQLNIKAETVSLRLKTAEEEIKAIKDIVYEPVNKSLRKRFEEYKRNNAK